jgi:LysR family hydrogen peroxide-inducible transcriptional activator
MQRKEFDVGIMAGPHLDVSLRKIHLYNEEILVYAPQLGKTKIKSDDLRDIQPWLLNHGNCLRTQMIEFCQLSEDQFGQKWNYEGGNIDLLLKMVELHGGYSLVPEFYEVTARQRDSLSRIYAEDEHENPGREIIALVPNRSMKWDIIERMLREAQLEFISSNKNSIKILNWRS